MPVLDFAGPGSMVQSGEMVPIPNVSGMNVYDARSALTAAGFTPSVGKAVSSSYSVGTVIRTQPTQMAHRGSQVEMVVSSGYVRPKPVASPRNTAQNPLAKLPKCRPGGPRPCRR
jgi:beta-lactam-binding protein with PASTA domain